MTRDGWLVAAAFALGAAGLWAGPAGGDFVAYLAQARAGDLADRATHVGFVALLVPFAGLPVPWPLLSAAAFAWVAARNAETAWGRGASLAAIASLAPFPEVEPAWLALLWTGGPVAVALAVAVSPTAALAVLASPARRDAWAGPLAVVALTVLTAGAWWWGERGVLTAPGWAPGKVAAAWLAGVPWLLLPAVRADARLWRDLAWSVPLLLLPADVPGWAVPALALARAVDPARSAWVVAQAVVSTARVAALAWGVRGENVVIARVAAELGPTDGVEAPWSWGARVAVAASGDPYGVRWHPPGRFLRRQREAWCDAPPARVVVLPPRDGVVEIRTDGADACR